MDHTQTPQKENIYTENDIKRILIRNEVCLTLQDSLEESSPAYAAASSSIGKD